MDIEVSGAVLIADPKGNYWALSATVTHDDGRIEHGGYVIPVDVFEWRAAEYDTEDKDELLEILLYERWLNSDESDELMDKPFDRSHLQQVIARKKNGGKISTRNKRADESVVTKVRRSSGNTVAMNSETDPDLPIDFVKREIRLDPTRVQAKKSVIAKLRAKSSTV